MCRISPAVFAATFIIFGGCGSQEFPSPSNSANAISSLSPEATPNPKLTAWKKKADSLGIITLSKPEGSDPLTHKKNIAYLGKNITPESMNSVPKAPRKMTEDEGRAFYFDGLLRLVETANTPSPDSSEFEKAIDAGRIVEPPCATTNSQVMKAAAIKAKQQWVATLFENPHNYYPTHNNEYQLYLMGWNYYLKAEYIAPPASIGMWDRYVFTGLPGHSGHVYVIFKDGGLKGPDLIGDNTRQKDELHGHPYRMPGSTQGFWLPPGVYPNKR
jgi:hypothetical protein